MAYQEVFPGFHKQRIQHLYVHWHRWIKVLKWSQLEAAMFGFGSLVVWENQFCLAILIPFVHHLIWMMISEMFQYSLINPSPILLVNFPYWAEWINIYYIILYLITTMWLLMYTKLTIWYGKNIFVYPSRPIGFVQNLSYGNSTVFLFLF